MEHFYIEQYEDVFKVYKQKNGKLHSFNDEPAVYTEDGHKEWYKDGKLHRDNDKPAVQNKEGFEMYYQNGKRHRANGKPAVIFPDGSSEYWIEGKTMSKNLYLKLITQKKVNSF